MSEKQKPVRDGVKDLPSVPGSLNGTGTPPLGPVGHVPDKSSPDKRSTS